MDSPLYSYRDIQRGVRARDTKLIEYLVKEYSALPLGQNILTEGE